MSIYFDYNKIPKKTGTVITLGNFDGFHLGHQRIVHHTVANARQMGLHSVVITFWPHPRQLFSGDLAVLTPMERKVNLLKEAGVDIVLVQPFTKDFAATDPGLFLRDVLFHSLNCQHIVVGYDYAFGKGGAGNTMFLEHEAAKAGIGSEVIQPVTHKQEIISSTAIRRYLSQGNVEMAARFMDRLYSVRGRVETGAGRGVKLGFPTANIYPAPAIALPAFGVYMVKVIDDAEIYWGVANVGTHPTFPEDKISLEIYLLNYHGNLYQRILDVQFCKRLRDEVMFADGQSLARQIEQDVAQVQALLRHDNMLKLQSV